MSGANAQMGTLRLERNGFLGTDRCSVSPKPIFGVILNLKYGLRIGGLGIRTPGFMGSTVLASVRPTAEALLVKELKFSPAFRDYVKVLESIQTDRSKHPNSESEDSNMRQRLGGDDDVGRARNKGDKKSPDPRVGSQNRGIHTDRRLESYSDGDQLSHERRDKYLSNEHNEKPKSDETKRNRRHLVENTLKKTRAWKSDSNGRDRERNLRTISEKHERNKQVHDTETNGTWGGGRSVIHEEDLEWNCTQPRKHLNNLGRKMSKSDIGKTVKKGKTLGGIGLSGNRFQGKMGNIKILKSSLKKMNTLKDNSDGTLAESESTRNRFEKGKLHEIEMGKRMDESGIHESPLSRDISTCKIDGKKESIIGSSQCSVLDPQSGRVQQKLNLDGIEIDDTESGRNAFDNSTEINEEPRNQRHVRFHRDVIITKKSGSKFFKIDETPGITDVQADNNAGRHVGNIELNDRAAFKTFEVFTDIKNRPRVLRMELEERIQNLAKRLNATDVNMPEWKFSKLIHDAKIKFTDHSILRIVQILGAFGNWRRVLQVVEWLQSRERFKSYKSRYIYTTVLNVLGKAKRPMEALNVFYAMRQELSSYPDLAAYHCIAVILGQAGLMKELFDVIDCMRAIPEKKFKLGVLQKWDPRLEPDLVIYNTVLNACVQQKQWEGAFWVLQELKQKGIKPSSTTYGLVMEIDKLCKVAQKPLVVSYTGLIQTCLDSGSIQNATYIFNQMHKFCSPNVVTCNVMLKSYVEHGMFQEAKCLFQKILEGNKCINQKSDLRGKVVPDKFTFNTMMEACRDTKHWDDFEYAYEQMLHYGFHFDAKRHLRMVMEASRAGKVQLLDTTLEHLISSGRTPPPAIVKERFCLRLIDGDCVGALSCLDISEACKLQCYSEKSWLDTLNANLYRFGKTVLTRLSSEIDYLPSQGYQKHPVHQNLLNACKKVTSSSTNTIAQSDSQKTFV